MIDVRDISVSYQTHLILRDVSLSLRGGDIVVLGDGLVDLPGADVQISQRVGGIPVGGLVLDHRTVLRDGEVELSLAEQLLRFAERSLAVKWHRQQSWKTTGD